MGFRKRARALTQSPWDSCGEGGLPATDRDRAPAAAVTLQRDAAISSADHRGLTPVVPEFTPHHPRMLGPFGRRGDPLIPVVGRDYQSSCDNVKRRLDRWHTLRLARRAPGQGGGAPSPAQPGDCQRAAARPPRGPRPDLPEGRGPAPTGLPPRPRGLPPGSSRAAARLREGCRARAPGRWRPGDDPGPPGISSPSRPASAGDRASGRG